jgi:hypothetical protein
VEKKEEENQEKRKVGKEKERKEEKIANLPNQPLFPFRTLFPLPSTSSGSPKSLCNSFLRAIIFGDHSKSGMLGL